jgi:hypothetical protein
MHTRSAWNHWGQDAAERTVGLVILWSYVLVVSLYGLRATPKGRTGAKERSMSKQIRGYGTIKEYEWGLKSALLAYAKERKGFVHDVTMKENDVLIARAHDLDLVYARLCVGLNTYFKEVPKEAFVFIKQDPKIETEKGQYKASVRMRYSV